MGRGRHGSTDSLCLLPTEPNPHFLNLLVLSGCVLLESEAARGWWQGRAETTPCWKGGKETREVGELGRHIKHCLAPVVIILSKRNSLALCTDIDPPRNLHPSAVTQSGGVLTWTAPSAQIDGYILTYQFPDGTVKVLDTSHFSSGCPCPPTTCRP